MHVQMIVFYIEMHMRSKRGVQNVGVTGTRNTKTSVRHMVLLIRY